MERNPEDTDIRIVRQIKNSLSPSDAEMRSEIRPQTGFAWLGVEKVPMVQKKTESPTFGTKMDKAAYLTKEILPQGNVRSVYMYEPLKAKVISQRTAEDTRKGMGVQCYRK